MKVYRLGDKLLRQCTVSPCTTLIPLERSLCYFHFPTKVTPRPTPDGGAHPIVRQVAREWMVRPTDLIGRLPHRWLKEARSTVIRRMLTETAMSVVEIARSLQIDHTTVSYYQREIYAEGIAK